MKEDLNNKYTAYIKTEVENDNIFKQVNIEKPTKWFLNIAKAKKMNESPSNKILDPKSGKKFANSTELREHVHKHFQNIFKLKKTIQYKHRSFLKRCQKQSKHYE